jgi:hypothetical protein
VSIAVPAIALPERDASRRKRGVLASSERVRVRRPGEHIGFRPVFDDLAQVHHRDRIGDMAHDLQIVRNKKIGDAHFPLQIHHQVEHLGLIETSSAETARRRRPASDAA